MANYFMGIDQGYKVVSPADPAETPEVIAAVMRTVSGDMLWEEIVKRLRHNIKKHGRAKWLAELTDCQVVIDYISEPDLVPSKKSRRTAMAENCLKCGKEHPDSSAVCKIEKAQEIICALKILNLDSRSLLSRIKDDLERGLNDSALRHLAFVDILLESDSTPLALAEEKMRDAAVRLSNYMNKFYSSPAWSEEKFLMLLWAYRAACAEYERLKGVKP